MSNIAEIQLSRKLVTSMKNYQDANFLKKNWKITAQSMKSADVLKKTKRE